MQLHHCGPELALNKKASTLARCCIDFFNREPDALDTFLRTVKRQESFSLRIVDWAVTNYSRRHRITVHHKGLPVDINHDYRRHLGVFTKKYFDPFARRERIELVLTPANTVLSTTVGQLNFMKWLLERGIHVHIAQLRAEIETDMRDNHGRRKKHPKDDTTTAATAATAKQTKKHEDRFLIYNGPFRLLF